MIIGKIVKSNSHIDYFCRILDRLETAEPPQPAHYPFGQFVHVGTEAVGIIYDSQLINPDYGNYGPRLTTPPEQNAVFSPDYLNEQATLVSILLLGWLEAEGGVQHVPRYVIPINTEVGTMEEEAIRRFHLNQRQELQLHYYSHILTHTGPIGIQLLLTVIDQLSRLFANDVSRLKILQDTLSWQLTLGQVR